MQNNQDGTSAGLQLQEQEHWTFVSSIATGTEARNVIAHSHDV